MTRSEVVAAVAGALVLLGSAVAHAQSAPSPVVPTPPPPADASADMRVASGPNLPVMVTGLLTLGIAYVPAAVVATSSNFSSDSLLVVPVVGPWLDLADRPACGPGGVSCRIETGNTVLLVVDGLFQAWGVAAAVAGIFVKDYPRPAPTVHVSPTQLGSGGYGVAAFGTF